MSQELIYTSAPKGLKPGVQGFCTVASTPAMPGPLASLLESLSGYRPLFMPGDPQEALNPVNWSHVRLTSGGRQYSVLSRIASYGLDYSRRNNKLAHHLVLEAHERVSVGPGWCLSEPQVMETEWVGEPRVMPGGRVMPDAERPPRVCRAWAAMTGDAGWAGVLAESFLADPERLVFLLFRPGQNLLPLIEEAIALLPADSRWDATFSTYFTAIPPNVSCQWRCIPKDSPEANDSRRFVKALRLDLTAPLGEANGGNLVQCARTGDRPDWGASASSTEEMEFASGDTDSEDEVVPGATRSPAGQQVLRRLTQPPPMPMEPGEYPFHAPGQIRRTESVASPPPLPGAPLRQRTGSNPLLWLGIGGGVLCFVLAIGGAVLFLSGVAPRPPAVAAVREPVFRDFSEKGVCEHTVKLEPEMNHELLKERMPDGWKLTVNVDEGSVFPPFLDRNALSKEGILKLAEKAATQPQAALTTCKLTIEAIHEQTNKKLEAVKLLLRFWATPAIRKNVRPAATSDEVSFRLFEDGALVPDSVKVEVEAIKRQGHESLIEGKDYRWDQPTGVLTLWSGHQGNEVTTGDYTVTLKSSVTLSEPVRGFPPEESNTVPLKVVEKLRIRRGETDDASELVIPADDKAIRWQAITGGVPPYTVKELKSKGDKAIFEAAHDVQESGMLECRAPKDTERTSGTFHIKVTDSSEQPKPISETVNFIVVPVPRIVALEQYVFVFKEGQPSNVRLRLVASDSKLPATVRFDDKLPPGLNPEGQTGEVTGSPTEVCGVREIPLIVTYRGDREVRGKTRMEVRDTVSTEVLDALRQLPPDRSFNLPSGGNETTFSIEHPLKATYDKLEVDVPKVVDLRLLVPGRDDWKTVKMPDSSHPKWNLCLKDEKTVLHTLMIVQPSPTTRVKVLPNLPLENQDEALALAFLQCVFADGAIRLYPLEPFTRLRDSLRVPESPSPFTAIHFDKQPGVGVLNQCLTGGNGKTDKRLFVSRALLTSPVPGLVMLPRKQDNPLCGERDGPLPETADQSKIVATLADFRRSDPNPSESDLPAGLSFVSLVLVGDTISPGGGKEGASRAWNVKTLFRSQLSWDNGSRIPGGDLDKPKPESGHSVSVFSKELTAMAQRWSRENSEVRASKYGMLSPDLAQLLPNVKVEDAYQEISALRQKWRTFDEGPDSKKKTSQDPGARVRDLFRGLESLEKWNQTLAWLKALDTATYSVSVDLEFQLQNHPFRPPLIEIGPPVANPPVEKK
jgi:hypothetical protein